MKKFLTAAFLLLSPAAQAGVSCSLPFNLQNNTLADATQVMANYNALVACLLNAAHSGSNSDITSLSALATPLTPAQGGSSVYVGGTTTGSANTQILATPSPTGFTLATGKRVSFIAGFTNTGAMTLNVSGLGATAVYRQTTQGAVTTAGGEVIAGTYIEVVFDGTRFQLLNQGITNVGEIRDWAGSAASTVPPGYLFAAGQCVSRTTYATLFAVTGTTYDNSSGCSGSDFPLPDLRGRATFAKDNQGGTAANRLLQSCDGTTVGGAGCGSEGYQMTIEQMPTHNHDITDPGHTHEYSRFDGANNSAGGGNPPGGTNSTQNTGSSTTGITTNDRGDGDFYEVLNPLLIVYKIIKF